MVSGANFIAIVCIWLVAIVAAVYIFMPTITSSIGTIQTYDAVGYDESLRDQLQLNEDTTLQSLTPLGIFEYLQF